MNIPRPTAAMPLRHANGALRFIPAALLSAVALGVQAAPPPGHPSPSDAMQIMRSDGGRAATGKHTGVALDAIDANEYIYIEVDEAGVSYWIATSKMKIMRGDMVQFEEGVTIDQFYSKLLKRTFPSVMFVGGVSTTPGGK